MTTIECPQAVELIPTTEAAATTMASILTHKHPLAAAAPMRLTPFQRPCTHVSPLTCSRRYPGSTSATPRIDRGFDSPLDPVTSEVLPLSYGVFHLEISTSLMAWLLRRYRDPQVPNRSPSITNNGMQESSANQSRGCPCAPKHTPIPSYRHCWRPLTQRSTVTQKSVNRAPEGDLNCGRVGVHFPIGQILRSMPTTLWTLLPLRLLLVNRIPWQWLEGERPTLRPLLLLLRQLRQQWPWQLYSPHREAHPEKPWNRRRGTKDHHRQPHRVWVVPWPAGTSC